MIKRYPAAFFHARRARKLQRIRERSRFTVRALRRWFVKHANAMGTPCPPEAIDVELRVDAATGAFLCARGFAWTAAPGPVPEDCKA